MRFGSMTVFSGPKVSTQRPKVPTLHRHGPACPGHTFQHSAVTGGPDEPSHDEMGEIGEDFEPLESHCHVGLPVIASVAKQSACAGTRRLQRRFAPNKKEEKIFSGEVDNSAPISLRGVGHRPVGTRSDSGGFARDNGGRCARYGRGRCARGVCNDDNDRSP
jgi:hypothetical protein